MCRLCGEHVGWRYDHQQEGLAEEDAEQVAGAEPPLQQFFGLRRDVFVLTKD